MSDFKSDDYIKYKQWNYRKANGTNRQSTGDYLDLGESERRLCKTRE
jgi:hypothetical protein